jgi:hypothetical protein
MMRNNPKSVVAAYATIAVLPRNTINEIFRDVKQ